MFLSPDYKCITCGHTAASHDIKGCGALDNAGDTCDCVAFAHSQSESKRHKIQSIDRLPTDEKTQKALQLVERFCLVKDGSGHRYVIPVYQKEAFEKWSESFESGNSSHYDCEEYEAYRLDGGILTFTDPKVN